MKKTINLLKVLAEPTRLKVVTMLKDGPKFVSELKKATKVEPTLLSHHLALLRKAGFVTSRRIGKRVECELVKGISIKNGIKTAAFKITFA